MNRIEIAAEEVPLPENIDVLKSFLKNVLKAIKKNNWELSILFCNDDFIRILNRRFRTKDEATDVLSFPLGETIIENSKEYYAAGDIVISLETLAKNSILYAVDKYEELRRLLVHGILHLDGMDHQTNDPSESMLQKQEQILESVTI
ncbi:endoribonuclease YbeY [Spirochaetia bacterium]|nr:endoribonuclease YbeY [Spirochaetia bacterium]